MKRFIQIFGMCFVVMCMFFFFGGFLLFDIHYNAYLAAASIAFVLAIVINGYIGQAEKIEELETRIGNLEKQQSGEKSVRQE